MIKEKKRRSPGKIIESFEERKFMFSGGPKGSLTRKLKKTAGRDNRGKISIRHKGGGVKKTYRVLSELGDLNQEVKVLNIEYDPYRSARIALVELKNGQNKYIIAGEDLKPGKKIFMGDRKNLKRNERSKLANIAVGSSIYDIQLYPNSKNCIARSAGTSAILMALEGGYALVKLPSGEQKRINEKCLATIGQVSNKDHSNIIIGKAGRKRKMGIRPTVRGKAMHPGAHPHGGGEGVNPIGLKYPKTPWGKMAIGKKTRRNTKSDTFIVERRPTKKR